MHPPGNNLRIERNLTPTCESCHPLVSRKTFLSSFYINIVNSYLQKATKECILLKVTLESKGMPPQPAKAANASFNFLREKGEFISILQVINQPKLTYDRFGDDELLLRALRWPHPSLEVFISYDVICQYEANIRQQATMNQPSNAASSSSPSISSTIASIGAMDQPSNAASSSSVASCSNPYNSSTIAHIAASGDC